MRTIAGVALTWSAIFLSIVAVLIGSAALFYIAVAMIAMIGACNLQAHLAVRGLRVERGVPASVRVGDLVTVDVLLWSEHKIRRPLVSVVDRLPARLLTIHRSPSLPVAPSFDSAVRTQYQFRPLRRGFFRWSQVTVRGMDALGVIARERTYETEEAEMIVLPRPLPVSVDLPTSAGWGTSEAESGNTRGAGIEPRGIREYQTGDPLRNVHWRSTAKAGRLLVKEFEAGSQATVAFVLQRTRGSEVGSGVNSTLEQICGHASFLADSYLRQGVRVDLPGLEESGAHHNPHERLGQIEHALALVEANQNEELSDVLRRLPGDVPKGCVIFVFLAVPDEGLPDTIVWLQSQGHTVIPLVYDAAAFDPKKKVKSAVDDEYLTLLRSSGISPILMPCEFMGEAE